MESGGGIKFDLKTWDENSNRVLSGVSNRETLKNFERLGEFHSRREAPTFLRASTPLVQGYIDVEEVKKIASFIAGIEQEIPYSLLVFHPDYRFHDLPVTNRELALKAKRAAVNEGLKNVRIGNKHLLM